MANYREKMREYLKEPNEYSNQYGKWGILNREQRQLIGRLLNEMDNADVVIKKQYEEKQQLINWLEDKIKEKNDVLERLEGTDSIRISILQSQLKAFQEVLDFVDKGGKDD